MLQTVARDAYFGSPGAGAEEGQPLRWRHRSSAARGEPSGAQRSRETAARIRPGCRAHAARRKRQMGEEVGSLSALQGCQRCERTLALFSGLARRGGEPNVYVHSMTLPPPCFVLLCAEISPTPLRLKAVCLSPLFALWQRACTLHHVRLWVVYEAAGRCVQRSLFAQARRPRRTRAGYYRGATLARNELHLSPGTRVPLCLTTHTNIVRGCAGLPR